MPRFDWVNPVSGFSPVDEEPHYSESYDDGISNVYTGSEDPKPSKPVAFPDLTNITSVNEARKPASDPLNSSAASSSPNSTGNLSESNANGASAEFKELDEYISGIEKEIEEITTRINNSPSAIRFWENELKNANAFDLRDLLGLEKPLTNTVNATLERLKKSGERDAARLALLTNLLHDAKAKKVEAITNANLERTRYRREMDALSLVGVRNPFYMLRNGSLSSSTSFGLGGTGSANYSTVSSNAPDKDNSKDKKGDFFKSILEFFKMLLLMKAAKK